MEMGCWESCHDWSNWRKKIRLAVSWMKIARLAIEGLLIQWALCSWGPYRFSILQHLSSSDPIAQPSPSSSNAPHADVSIFPNSTCHFYIASPHIIFFRSKRSTLSTTSISCAITRTLHHIECARTVCIGRANYVTSGVRWKSKLLFDIIPACLLSCQ